MGLHPDNAVWFTRAPGHKVRVLEASSSFQAPPAVALGFPEYEQFLAFSKEHTNFPGKLRRTTYLPASCFSSVNGKDSS